MGVKQQQQLFFSFTSMYDVLLDNLQKSHMRVHLYRVIYIGEHSNERAEQLHEFFAECLARINRDALDALCALFIHYSRHFVLMLEGSEEDIVRHLTILTQSASVHAIGAIHVLIMLRANQRLLDPENGWRVLQLNPSAEAHMSTRRMSTGEPWQQARICVDKIFRLAGVLAAAQMSCVSGPLMDNAMVPDAGNLRQVIGTGLLQNCGDFAARLAPPSTLANFNDHIWPPEDFS
ncbi:uncharacterized protein LOC135946208 [Cloeon dipterum]|uniref:uncharacterized protein LOC135946208 n=1 Tax=Cloeon dipterum TaxID=197152 RepID=UPI0032202D8A